MRWPEDLTLSKPPGPAPFSYTIYRGIGWAFVFSMYFLSMACGFLFIEGFHRKLLQAVRIIAAWESLGVLVFIRWELALSPSGGLWYLYELLFPWKYGKEGEE